MTDNELTEHTVEIDGIEHTMLLNEADAKRYGDAAKAQKAATKSATKATTPANK